MSHGGPHPTLGVPFCIKGERSLDTPWRYSMKIWLKSLNFPEKCQKSGFFCRIFSPLNVRNYIKINSMLCFTHGLSIHNSGSEAEISLTQLNELWRFKPIRTSEMRDSRFFGRQRGNGRPTLGQQLTWIHTVNLSKTLRPKSSSPDPIEHCL